MYHAWAVNSSDGVCSPRKGLSAVSIEELRKQIDELDERIVALINKRAGLAKEIGKLKRQANSTVYAPHREEEVFNNVLKRNEGQLTPESLQAIYREIMSACRAVERPTKVSFLGPEGTFSHQAAHKMFGSSLEYIPVNGIDAVFMEVERGHADYGVVPIENSTDGGIGDTLDEFIEADVKVCREILLPIHHNLMAQCEKAEIQRIYSKPQVFAQCRGWLSANCPGIEQVDTGSTTQAAGLAAREEYAAAIANEEAAETYGLRILFRNIEDHHNNMTRFFVLGAQCSKPTGHDKSSILCFIKDEVGALHGILLPFMEEGINLTRIESWPSKRKKWDYCFFIDFEGHYSDKAVATALDKVKQHCSEMKLLGSFPAAEG